MALILRMFFSGLLLLSEFTAEAGRAPQAAPLHPLFVTAEDCMACHNGLSAPSGEDVSLGVGWRSSMMANSARDPYWQAAVRREVMDHPAAQAAIENECAACHMPMTRFQAKAAGHLGAVFENLPVGESQADDALLAADGVSCTACHQILDQNLGSKASFTGGFGVDTSAPIGQRRIYGPFEVDGGRTRIMRSASGFQPEQGLHIGRSELCATCHTLYTHTLGPDGEPIGELPEQVPYLEWRHSDYRESQECQVCHMPTVAADMPISSVLGQPRSGFHRHVFKGGNFFMPRLLNRYRDQLGVKALPQELEATSRRTLEHLESEAARVTVENVSLSGGRLRAEVVVESMAGHKLPTAYPSRRVWIRLAVLDRDGAAVFVSGNFRPDGSIGGNDNDADASRFEPHHEEIDSADQVQIYEAIMVDAADVVTTGLLTGLRYIKDNRILPRGFDKTTAEKDVAVWGRAAQDGDFHGGGDRVRYSAALGQARGPYTVEAELWYQPIAYRWAHNLRRQPSFETDRFVGFYDSMAGSSATVLARHRLRTP